MVSCNLVYAYEDIVCNAIKQLPLGPIQTSHLCSVGDAGEGCARHEDGDEETLHLKVNPEMH